MGRVTTLDPGAVVLASGTLNLKRFEQRTGETLVLGELLDRRVTIDESGRPATVVDAAIEQTRTGDWVLSRLAVQEPGRLGRRGQLHQLAWDEVTGLSLPQGGQSAETLIATYRDLNAADVAHALQDLPIKRRHEVAEALDDERLADVLGELPEAEQITILGTLEERRGADAPGGVGPHHGPGRLGGAGDGDPTPPPGAGRRRPGGDGPRRRRGPAGRAVERRPQPAAGADGARRGRAGAPAAQVLRGHRRRDHDERAGDPGPRRHHRRGAGPGPGARADAGAGQPGLRLPAAVGDPDRPLPGAGAHPAAAARTTVGAGQRRPGRPGSAAAGDAAGRGDPLLRHLQPGGRAGGRRAGPAGRRRQRGRCAGPPAARGLAGAGATWLMTADPSSGWTPRAASGG